MVSRAAASPIFVSSQDSGWNIVMKKRRLFAQALARRSGYFFAMLFGSISPAKNTATVVRIVLTVTALTPIIGYENAAKAAKKALDENKTLKQAVTELGLMTEEDFDESFHPERMV